MLGSFLVSLKGLFMASRNFQDEFLNSMASLGNLFHIGLNMSYSIRYSRVFKQLSDQTFNNFILGVVLLH